MHKHVSDIHIKYWEYVAYLPNLVSILVSGTYLAIIFEVAVAVGCILVIYAKMLGLHDHLGCCLCELYLELAAISFRDVCQMCVHFLLRGWY